MIKEACSYRIKQNPDSTMDVERKRKDALSVGMYGVDEAIEARSRIGYPELTPGNFNALKAVFPDKKLLGNLVADVPSELFPMVREAIGSSEIGDIEVYTEDMTRKGGFICAYPKGSAPAYRKNRVLIAGWGAYCNELTEAKMMLEVAMHSLRLRKFTYLTEKRNELNAILDNFDEVALAHLQGDTVYLLS